jgi:hypothetical protein
MLGVGSLWGEGEGGGALKELPIADRMGAQVCHTGGTYCFCHRNPIHEPLPARFLERLRRGGRCRQDRSWLLPGQSCRPLGLLWATTGLA